MPLAMLERRGFTAGIKPAYAPHEIPKNALWQARNVDADEVGVLSVRPGAEAVADSLGAGGIYGLTAAFGTLVCVWNRSLYKLVSGAWVAIRTNFLPANTWVNMVKWEYDDQEVLYIHAGQGLWRATAYGCVMVDPTEPGEGLGNVLLAEGGGQNPDSEVFMAEIGLLRPGYSSRMAVAYGNAVYLSDPDDPRCWPNDQWLTLPDDGGTITGLALRYNALIIFRDTDIWAVFGSDWSNAENPPIVVLQDSSVGCVAPRSIVSVPGLGVLFLGPDNVYALRGVAGVEDQVQAVPVGDDIKPHLAAAMAHGAAGACAVYHDRQYHLSFPSALDSERIFRLRAAPQGWYCDSGPKTAGYAVRDGKLYSADPEYGLVYERTGYTDNGARIPWMIAFPHETLSAGPARIKRLFLYLNATDTMQHIDATVISDGGGMEAIEFAVAGAAGPQWKLGDDSDEGAPLDTSSFGPTSEIKVYEAKVSGLKGQFAQVQVNGNKVGEDLRIIGYALQFRPKARAKGIRTGVTRYDDTA